MEKLKYYAYVSRSKVDQLYDQISDMAVEKKTTKRGLTGDTKAEIGSNGLFGFLKGGFSLASNRSESFEEVGRETSIHKLSHIIEHIQKNERVLDLNELCKNRNKVALDAFCYRYSGSFSTLASIGRKYGGVHINQKSLDRAADEIIISKDLLLKPGRSENEYKEAGPNNGSLVSDMCIINSQVGEFTISLACSYKYFSDMGGHWHESEKEWEVFPHSGNHHFFSGYTEAWLDSIIFINGIREKTIMGTPLFLTHGQNPNLVI